MRRGHPLVASPIDRDDDDDGKQDEDDGLAAVAVIGDVGQRKDTEDTHHDGGDGRERRRATTEEPLRFGGVAAVFGHEQPGECVEQQPDAAKNGEGGKDDAQE